jgi:hypothetical protein
MKHAFGIVAALLFLLAGCQNPNRAAVGPRPPGVRASITHVVVCWLKDPDSAAQRQALLDAATKIRSLPEVADVTVGRHLPTDNPFADNSWDVAFVITFDDEADLHTYEKDPVHLRLKREVLAPNVRKVKVFDIKE